MTTRVVIVRHGQSSYNTERRIQGRSDASTLTAKGYSDALKVGEVLSHLNFAAVYTSPLQRAKKTAEVICDRLSTSAAQPQDNLREIDLPLWEGMLLQEVRDQFSEDYRCWHQQPHQLLMMISDSQGTSTLR